MGWFLTRKKPTKGKAAKGFKTSAAAPKPWDPKRTLRGLKILGGVALAAGAVVGWHYGEQGLRDYVGTVLADPVSVQDVVLADAPPWMSPEVRTRVATVVAEPLSPNPLDGRGLRASAMALAAEPWVVRVERVRRLGDGRIEVHAQYRQPVAIVEGMDGYHLVDASGVKLPHLYYRDQVSRLGLPMIRGVAAAPPRAGEPWPGEDLQAGLKLVELLANEPYLGQIRAFDVGARDARGRLRLALQTERGLVRWGLPPGQENAVEPAAATKVRWLRELDARSGSIDMGGKIVDVFGEAIQWSEPAMNLGPSGDYTLVGQRR